MQLEIIEQSWPIDGVFTISRGSRTHAHVLQIKLTQGQYCGYGECVPYARYQETLDSVKAQIEALKPAIISGLTLDELQQALPAGAARNAIDSALWDLQCKTNHQTIGQRLGIALHPVMTAYTLSLDTPQAMQQKARVHQLRPRLKMKLAGDGDLERVQAVRAIAPDAQIIVDANEGWDRTTYENLVPKLLKLNVALIEQPFPVAKDAWLSELPRPIAIAADESCHTRHDLDVLKGRYDFINIKLDKTGGLTEALALKSAARQSGFGIMIGCMVGTSLAMAPAFVVAQQADIVDLDGPLLLAKDQKYALSYSDKSQMDGLTPQLWG